MAPEEHGEVIVEEVLVVIEDREVNGAEHRRKLQYFVNGEPFTTEQHRRKLRVILADAGFDPVEQYKLERDSDQQVFEDYDAEVHLHEGERFTATYIGPTPTS